METHGVNLQFWLVDKSNATEHLAYFHFIFKKKYILQTLIKCLINTLN